MSTDLATRPRRGVFYERSEPSLMLSTANPPDVDQGGRHKHPQRLNFFRAKPGADGRWKAAAKAFNEAFECEVDQHGNALTGPKSLVVRFPFASIADVLDVRYLAFAQGRLAAKGDRNYTALAEWEHHTPEWITAYPLEGEAERFQITGPDDPLCLGGHHDIPTDRDNRPTLRLTATLNFTLCEVGSLLAITAYQTSGVTARTRLWKGLKRLESLGPLTNWLCLLRVVPYTYRYRDAKLKSHSTRGYTVDLYGPIRSLDDRASITVADAFAQIEKSANLGLIGQGQPIAQLPPAREADATPAGWTDPDEAEGVEGEVVDEHNPDDDIPFGRDDEDVTF